ncbi:MAG: OsmC family protein [Armatimonadetes bacterium]|nr:OsmC family protein [Armatimonadota bacterium]MBS1710357.1 OsmC family protein [Armatimonadota bacterium]MBX3109006.1 OsmC family protein [Fimbriimonadaceae bacterium]
MVKTASAVWNNGIKDGSGTISTQSGVLQNVPYGVATRFEGVNGANPEELVAAAHASCFSMALSLFLNNNGMNPVKIETTCEITLEKGDTGFSVTKSHLTTKVDMPGADPAKFQEVAAEAKANCPISKLLNAEISLDATLA